MQPTTQQFVRFTNGKYALLDLYFPQLNFGIEIDEAHHLNNHYKDQERERSVEEVLSAYDVSKAFILRRIKAYVDIDLIHLEIDKIVEEIKQTIQQQNNFQKWTLSKPKYKDNQEVNLSVYDHTRYQSILEIAHLLGKNYKGIQKAYFKIIDNVYAWCPQLSIETSGNVHSLGKHGWLNYLSEDWNKIYESRLETHKIKPLGQQENHFRITFVKGRDQFGKLNYRFIGVYVFSVLESTDTLRVYNRISEYYKK